MKRSLSSGIAACTLPCACGWAIAGGGPLGIDSVVNSGDSGIWSRNNHFLEKPLAQGGLNMSRLYASLALLVFMAACVMLIPQRPSPTRNSA